MGTRLFPFHGGYKSGPLHRAFFSTFPAHHSRNPRLVRRLESPADSQTAVQIESSAASVKALIRCKSQSLGFSKVHFPGRRMNLQRVTDASGEPQNSNLELSLHVS